MSQEQIFRGLQEIVATKLGRPRTELGDDIRSGGRQGYRIRDGEVLLLISSF
jgi:hypothetical protein